MDTLLERVFGDTMGEWIQSFYKSPAPKVSREVKQLQVDWVAENSDAREEGLYREQYEERIATVKEAHDKDPLNPTKLLELAEIYGVMDPNDPHVLEYTERLCKYGELFFDKQRQGDVFQLYGRSLFLAARFQECLEVMLKAHACYRDNGNRKLRRINNIGLLRAYASLGNCKEASERLEVALTQCEEKDDSMLIYMHAKNALEKTGTARDAEILDDIWYVFLDTHPQEKAQWDGYKTMGDNVLRQTLDRDDEDDAKNFAEMLALFGPIMKRDLAQNPLFKVFGQAFIGILFIYIFVITMLHYKSGKGSILLRDEFSDME